MMHNWEYKRLGDVCTFIGGGTPSKSNSSFYKGNIPWATVRDMTEFELSKTELSITEEAVRLSATNILPKGTIIISTHVGLGKICILMQDTAINQDLKGVIFDSGSIVNKFFFSCWYTHISEYIISKGRGATVKGVTLDFMNRLSIPVPPLSVQEQIVAELDKINELIDDHREMLRQLDALAQSLFYDSFGELYDKQGSNNFRSINAVFETITDFVAAGSFASLRENVIYRDEISYAQLVRTMDIKSNFTKGQFVYVDEHAFNFLWRVNLDKECIILPNIGVNCGEVYYVKPSDLVSKHNVLGPNAILIRSKTFNHLYLSYALKSSDFQTQLAKITSQVAQPKFNKTNLKELQILLPPLELQESFARKIEAIEAQKTDIEASIADLQTLLNSRMDYWFN